MMDEEYYQIYKRAMLTGWLRGYFEESEGNAFWCKNCQYESPCMDDAVQHLKIHYEKMFVD